MSHFMETKIEFLKGVGPAKAALLQKDLGIFTFGDLMEHCPFRYEDRTSYHKISELTDETNYQVKGRLKQVQLTGTHKNQRLHAVIEDQTGSLDLVWFKGAQWISKKIKEGLIYTVYGKPSLFQHRYSISHPEIEVFVPTQDKQAPKLLPVYPSTERLKNKYLDSKALGKLTRTIIQHPNFKVTETIDEDILQSQQLIPLDKAIKSIHYPDHTLELQEAIKRLKFDELFFIQLKMFRNKSADQLKNKGVFLGNSQLLTEFYEKYLPFDLTGAQKKVIKEIYDDLKSGHQMNRLMQGDVGSGKTITAFICLLIAIGSGFQTTIMAPTEILAQQHYIGLKEHCDQLNIRIALITGSITKAKRRPILEQLREGKVDILVGTHALIEKSVEFQKLGLVVIDEQHRFGVAQRAKLWEKNEHLLPHVLVMTATPIPRTLAMTVYGDLDISTIDQLPAGRKPIKTTHMTDAGRLKLFGFMRSEIDLGRQIYLVYPLIEESETLSYKDLMDGYESIRRAFPQTPISILHGRMKPADKDYEMQRFVSGQTKIMVATTVIEVGVNVPNASVMVIENAERFGLSQLHQLRGRVGRGVDQSYCILMTGPKLSKEAKSRVECMVEHTDGFKIAERDLEIRGPGDLMGTQQSGELDLKLADLVTDGELLASVRQLAYEIIEKDAELINYPLLKSQLIKKQTNAIHWGNVS